jgi:hypothetical protein
MKLNTPLTAFNTAWFILLVISYMAVWIFAISLLGRLAGCQRLDSTDKDKWNPSEMGVHVDAATGVNYLTTWSGGICVRITTNGTPFISKP